MNWWHVEITTTKGPAGDYRHIPLTGILSRGSPGVPEEFPPQRGRTVGEGVLLGGVGEWKRRPTSRPPCRVGTVESPSWTGVLCARRSGTGHVFGSVRYRRGRGEVVERGQRSRRRIHLHLYLILDEVLFLLLQCVTRKNTSSRDRNLH